MSFSSCLTVGAPARGSRPPPPSTTSASPASSAGASTSRPSAGFVSGRLDVAVPPGRRRPPAARLRRLARITVHEVEPAERKERNHEAHDDGEEHELHAAWLLFSSLRWPASFCVNASAANWSASMASEIIVAHLWVAAVSGRACGAYATPSLSGKQFLLAWGSARGSPRIGAHRELLNCSRTFFGPQRLYGARSDAMPSRCELGINQGAGRDDRTAETSRGSR